MRKPIIFSLLLGITQTVSAANAELTFLCLKPIYEVGEYVIIDLQEDLQAPSRFHKVDLWVAIQLPSGQLLFLTPLPLTPTSLKPQPFRESLETTTRKHRLLEFELLEGLGGDYTFYALYVEEGKNPITDDFPVYRSNLAMAMTSLRNRKNPNSNIPPPEETPCYNSQSPQSYERFQDALPDGSLGPEMVVIPTGTFQMGDIQNVGVSDEKPVHQVSIASFAIGRYEVTHDEYVHFLNAVKHRGPEGEPWFKTKAEDQSSHIIGSPGIYQVETGYENHPMINISWYGAMAYADWLSEQTGKRYRLPSEAEWEYATRAKTETQYWWGNEIGSNRANCVNSECGDNFESTAPVGSFDPNPFGLYDTLGNVLEWVADPWHGNYEGAPTDGSVWTEGGDGHFVLRGGSWNYEARWVRAADRNWLDPTNRLANVGMRLAIAP
jgi:formylglycine-generating enzyme required for sulfatase activity